MNKRLLNKYGKIFDHFLMAIALLFVTTACKDKPVNGQIADIVYEAPKGDSASAFNVQYFARNSTSKALSSSQTLFDVIFSEPIDPTTFTTTDIVNTGTANVTEWSLEQITNNQFFILTAVKMDNDGTIIPQFSAGSISTTSGKTVALTTSSSHTDFKFPKITLTSDISAGRSHENYKTHILLSDSTISNFIDNDITTLATNTDSLTNIKEYVGNSNTTCILVDDGTVKCKGENVSGELGENGTLGVSSATYLTITNGVGGNLSNITQLKGSSYSSDEVSCFFGCSTNNVGDKWSTFCALDSSNEVQCWGYNGDGQLGNGTITNNDVPQTVILDSDGSNLSNIIKISTGVGYACALNTSGNVYCWGKNNYGQLGDGTTTDNAAAVMVEDVSANPLANVTDLAVGMGTACAIISDGTVSCWGAYGGLGDGTTVSKPYAIDMGIAGAEKIFGNDVYGNLNQPYDWMNNVTSPPSESSFTSSFCAVLTDTKAKCWGFNYYGQLGHDSYDQSSDINTAWGALTAYSVFTFQSASFGGPTYVSDGAGGELTDIHAVYFNELVQSCFVMKTAKIRCSGYGYGNLLTQRFPQQQGAVE